MPIKDLLNKLADAERRFIGAVFLAPIIGSNQVVVRIAGVVCRLKAISGLPRQFAGWAMLRCLSASAAGFVREATLVETASYLQLLPSVLLILVRREEDRCPASTVRWLAVPARLGDTRFRIQGLVSLMLPEDGLQPLDTVAARFDGRLF
jgi:hypothetical protein